MKYIRTDGNHIYERIEQRIMKSVYFGGEQYRHNLNSEWENIVEQADTIQELCDGFYIDVDLNVERNFEYAFHHFEHFAKTMKSFKTTSKVMVKRLGGGYGYIRTDKCLLYVAKLNDKGELELL